jgi:hypothetical protein
MTLEEIRKELEKDYPILRRKMNYVIHDLEKKLSKEKKKEGFVRFFDYCSKYKNNWIYRLHITQEILEGEALLLYHNGRGHAALQVTLDDDIVFITGHFFERYNERCKLGLKTIHDIIRAYMNENNVFDLQEVEEIKPGIMKIFSVIPSGVMLGMYNYHHKIIKANTFLTNDMLNKNQQELEFAIKFELEKYNDTSDNIFSEGFLKTMI